MVQEPSYEDLVHKIKILEKSLSELRNSSSRNTSVNKINLALLENSPVCTKIVDTNYNLQYMSSSGVNSLNIDDISEFYGTPYPLTFYPEDFKSNMRAKLELAKETGKTQMLEGSVNDIDGNAVWFHSTIVPVHNAKGKLDYFMVVSMDITERIKANHLLKESEEKFKSLAENSEDYILRYDNQHRHLYQNSAGYKVSGFTEDNFIGKTHRELGFDNKLCDIWDSKITQVFNTGEPNGEIFEWEGQNGSVFLDWRVFPEFNEAGDVETVIAVSRDITNQKIIENRLHESEKRFRQLTENINQVFWIGSLDWGQVFYVSPAYEKLWGLNSEALYENPRLWIESVHPDDQAQVIADIPTNPDNISAVVNFKDYRIQKTDGQIIWIKANAYPVRDSDGKVVGITGLAEDITERKLAEESIIESNSLLSSIIDSPENIIMFALDKSYNYLNFNKAHVKEMKYIYDTDIEIGKHIFSYMTNEDDIRKAKANYERVLKGERFVNHEEYGELENRLWYELIFNPIVNISNEITGFSVFVTDITERRKLEDELLKARKLESIGLLAGGIAHDFNNILTGLFGNIELAKRKLPSDHEAYSYINTADQALAKATNLTKQLLTFARGGDPLLEITNIGQVIQDTIKFSLSGSNVKTNLNLPDDLWQIKADKGQLSQVITNLVINADQAMATGGTLIIEAKNVKLVNSNIAPYLSGKFVKLSITDDGIGISAENLMQIFDPYFSTKQVGRGLGLATVHSIISKHNGYIDVVSESGFGTTFTIHLPADMSIEQITETTSSSKVEQSGSTFGNILIMDDDEMIQDLTTEMLESFGYTVDCAVDGNEAIEKYVSAEKSGNPFDVVIMDLTIPGGMGGKEAVKELLAINPKIKAIVSSGYSTDPIMAKYKDYGFTGRLSKPFQMDELQKVLSLHIAQN